MSALLKQQTGFIVAFRDVGENCIQALSYLLDSNKLWLLVEFWPCTQHRGRVGVFKLTESSEIQKNQQFQAQKS